jgi:hypothetical protein
MQPRLAVLIDADNIHDALAPIVLSRTAELGTPIIRRIYGRPGVMPGWTEATKNELYEYRVQPSVAAAKNSADIALVIDAMDLLYAGVAQAFCIVSNDRDFVPLALRLRAAGQAVHAICKEGDDRYAKAFDSVTELSPRNPIVDAFCKIPDAKEREFGLSEAGKLLRDVAPAGLIPPPGKGRLRKLLEGTGKFAFSGAGATMRVRLIS